MKTGTSIEIIHQDQHLLQFLVSCSNDYFSGQGQIYKQISSARKFSERSQVSPDQKDTRNFDLGNVDAKYAGGFVRMHSYCLDVRGRIAGEVKPSRVLVASVR